MEFMFCDLQVSQITLVGGYKFVKNVLIFKD